MDGKLAAVVMGALLAFPGMAVSDRLLIDKVEQEQAQADPRPVRGMSMDRVEARFGAPAARRGPVGDPPITRWEYGDFIVYFEYDKVLHAVEKTLKIAEN